MFFKPVLYFISGVLLAKMFFFILLIMTVLIPETPCFRFEMVQNR